jgi:flavin reductase (DIM6/NTAB) family NADH-FMN oxidoreductase RutF
MARTELDPAAMPGRAFYKLITASVVPRPIAWVSSLSADGVPNLAPHSFFTVACVEPPVLQFTSVGRKDSLNNVEATRQFVINTCPEWLFEQVNQTGTNFPETISEFEAVGIETEPSARVAPARVAGSPVAFECKLQETKSFGDSTVVFGRVIHAAVDPAVLDGDLPAVRSLKPLARLGRNEWSTVGEVLKINRIPYDDWEDRR